MVDIFVSYQRDDRRASFAVARALRELGYSVWIDEGIHAGASWDREIEREIHGASAVLVLWSSNSRESDWVRNEARLGKQSGKLVSIRIDDCHLPLEFSGVQTVDVFNLWEFQQADGWPRLLERIDLLKGRGPAGTTPASARPAPRPPATSSGSTGKAAVIATITLLALLVVGVLGIWSYLANRPKPDDEASPAKEQAEAEPVADATTAGSTYVPPARLPEAEGARSAAGPLVQAREGGGLIFRLGTEQPPMAQIERALSQISDQWHEREEGYVYVKAYANLLDTDIAAGAQQRGQLIRRQLRALAVPNSVILFYASDDDGQPGWAQPGTWSTDGRVEVYHTLYQEAGFAPAWAD